MYASQKILRENKQLSSHSIKHIYIKRLIFLIHHLSNIESNRRKLDSYANANQGMFIVISILKGFIFFFFASIKIEYLSVQLVSLYPRCCSMFLNGTSLKMNTRFRSTLKLHNCIKNFSSYEFNNLFLSH